MKITVGSKVWSCLDFFDAENYDRPNTPWFGEITNINGDGMNCGTIVIELISDIKTSSKARAFLFYHEKDIVKTNTKNNLGLEPKIDFKIDRKNDSKSDTKSDAKIDLKRGSKNDDKNDTKNDTKNNAELDVINGTKDGTKNDLKNDQVWIETDKLFLTEKECWVEYKRLLQEELSLANDAVEQLRIGIEIAQRKIDGTR